MKNKRGQTLGIAIIVAISIFIVGMMSLNFIYPEVTRARDSDNLDCSNSSISDGTKLTCLVADIVIPYFILLIISVVGGIITARLVI